MNKTVLDEDKDRWYSEVCEITDTVTHTVDQYPEIQETESFSTYTTVFGVVLKHVFFEVLTHEDVVALKKAAVGVLPQQLIH